MGIIGERLKLTQVRLAISRQPTGKAATKLRWYGLKGEVQNILNKTVEPSFFSYEFRRQLYEASPTCAICKNQIHSFDDSRVDHIYPHSKGGKTVLANGQLALSSCNARKSTRSQKEYVDDGGINEAHILLQVGHILAAGAISGLVLEYYLKLLCDQQQPPLIYGQIDGISKVNDALKKANVYDGIQWQQIQK